MPTLSRLPGYPAFLAAIFALFGWSNFRAVLLIQVLFDLGTCFLIADLARRLFSDRAAKAAFMLAAICPFLANYSAAALTETLEIFFTALALDFAVCGLAILRHGIADPAKPNARLGLAVASPSVPAFCCGPMAAFCWPLLAHICSCFFCKRLVRPQPGSFRPLYSHPARRSYSRSSARSLPWSHGRCATCTPCTASNPSLRAMPTIPTNPS